MLRSILVALDDTPGAIAARDVAIALARRTGATLTAAAVLDRPHTQDPHEAVPAGGGAFKERRDAALARRARQEAEAAFAACATAAGTQAFEPLLLEDAPEPALLSACVEHDLIVLGRDCTLGLEENEDGVAPVIQALLKDAARPLLVVPPGTAAGSAPQGEVLVGYDGSLPAMRALQLFALLGLHEGRAARVLSIGETAAAAQAVAEPAAAYLRCHGMEAGAIGAVDASPGDALLAEAARRPTGLMVAGAYGTTGLRAFFFGSTTQSLLRDAPCPLFVHH